MIYMNCSIAISSANMDLSFLAWIIWIERIQSQTWAISFKLKGEG